MSILPNLSYKLAYAHGLATSRRFAAACAQTEALQKKVLSRILKKSRNTAFGQEHGFSSIGSDVDAYRHTGRISSGKRPSRMEHRISHAARGWSRPDR